MPIEFVVDRDNSLLVTTYRGVVATEEYVGQVRSVLDRLDEYPGMDFLTDVSDIVHQATGGDIRTISAAIQEYAERIEGRKMAIVVSKTVVYGLMRMLQALMDGLPAHIEIFYEMDEAKRWLGVKS